VSGDILDTELAVPESVGRLLQSHLQVKFPFSRGPMSPVGHEPVDFRGSSHVIQ
jgi:hypothetical protein